MGKLILKNILNDNFVFNYSFFKTFIPFRILLWSIRRSVRHIINVIILYPNCFYFTINFFFFIEFPCFNWWTTVDTFCNGSVLVISSGFNFLFVYFLDAVLEVWAVTIVSLLLCSEVYSTVLGSLFQRVLSYSVLESENILPCFNPLLANFVQPPGFIDVTMQS